MTKQRKQYSTEFKLKMVKLIEEQNQRVVDVAKQYDIGKSTLENQLKRYRLELQGKPLATGHALTPEQRELGRLFQENAQLRLERDSLKRHPLYWCKTASYPANRAIDGAKPQHQ